MSTAQILTYTNRTRDRVLLILEPWAEQYWIEPGGRVDIKVSGGKQGYNIELEETANGIVVYGWEGCVAAVFCNGTELTPDPQPSH